MYLAPVRSTRCCPRRPRPPLMPLLSAPAHLLIPTLVPPHRHPPSYHPSPPPPHIALAFLTLPPKSLPRFKPSPPPPPRPPASLRAFSLFGLAPRGYRSSRCGLHSQARCFARYNACAQPPLAKSCIVSARRHLTIGHHDHTTTDCHHHDGRRHHSCPQFARMPQAKRSR